MRVETGAVYRNLNRGRSVTAVMGKRKGWRGRGPKARHIIMPK